MRLHAILTMTLLLFAAQLVAAKPQAAAPKIIGQAKATLTSPKSITKLEIATADGALTYRVTRNNKPLLAKQPLGIQTTPALGELNVVKVTTATKNERVKTAWGKVAAYDNHYGMAMITLKEAAGLKRTLCIVARVYDSGVAIRYEFPKDGNWPESFTLASDAMKIQFPTGGVAWCYNGESAASGPFKIKNAKALNLPTTIRFEDGRHVCLLNAAIFKAAPFSVRKSGENTFQIHTSNSKLAPGDVTNWRTFVMGDSAGDLLTSNMVHSLNPPCAIGDASWIEPGLSLWDWRAWGAETKNGFTYGLDMASWKRFIDFAAKHNVKYLLLDANWYGPEGNRKSNPVTSRDFILAKQGNKMIHQKPPADWKDPIDVPALIQYAKTKNVGIILYINSVARGAWDFEKTLATYQTWGAAGIKYGFLKSSGQKKVKDTREIVALCAKYKLLCNFHDKPIAPSGDRRTYPNYITREFCHAQSDAKRAFTPGGFCRTVFVNMVAGPLDMNNGMFELNNPAKTRPRVFRNINTTVVAECARVMITFSGVAILPDCPEAYMAKADLFAFLSALPMTWDETKILHGRIGEYITTARRSGKQWFIASANNETGRTLKLKLDFLDPGVTYTAKLYEDADDTDFKTNREAYRIRTITVKRGDTIDAVMANGGGHCIHITPKK